MSASNFRNKEYETVHHLTSRIAHRVFFLGDDERNDIMAMVRRASQFCGIKLLAWCIMTNHFHLLVYLPIPPSELSEEEILRRYAFLKGDKRREVQETQIAKWRSEGEYGLEKARMWFDRQRGHMYDIGEFMKIVKQWFTEEYNQRRSHVGTLWESVYHDRTVAFKDNGVEKCAAYIHLNPLRGAMCTGYTEYSWSSMTALAQGDEMALQGMQFICDRPWATAGDLVSRHTLLLDSLLEYEKRRRAEEIARERAAGYDVPCDSLTTEAMIAQATAHREMVIKSGVRIAENSSVYRRCAEKRTDAEQKIIEAINANSGVTPSEIARLIGRPMPTVYKYLKSLQNRKILMKSSRKSSWNISDFYR